jgi:cysteine desulfurase/selenocysteine lyase
MAAWMPRAARPDEALRSARRGAPVTRVAEARSAGRPGFDYLDSDEVYLDSACQTLRPSR